ncbi:50S ribosomal protein L33 (plasmid) [Pantoea sp. C3]
MRFAAARIRVRLVATAGQGNEASSRYVTTSNNGISSLEFRRFCSKCRVA